MCVYIYHMSITSLRQLGKTRILDILGVLGKCPVRLPLYIFVYFKRLNLVYL